MSKGRGQWKDRVLDDSDIDRNPEYAGFIKKLQEYHDKRGYVAYSTLIYVAGTRCLVFFGHWDTITSVALLMWWPRGRLTRLFLSWLFVVSCFNFPFWRSSTILTPEPELGRKKLDLLKLYKKVTDAGGYDNCTTEKGELRSIPAPWSSTSPL